MNKLTPPPPEIIKNYGFLMLSGGMKDNLNRLKSIKIEAKFVDDPKLFETTIEIFITSIDALQNDLKRLYSAFF